MSDAFTLKINPGFIGDVNKDLLKKMGKAGVYFQSKMRGYLNVSQKYTRGKSGRYRGLSPSSPGQFPKKLSGQLLKSITWKLDKSKFVLSVGTSLKGYPVFLETGTKRMKARPWLSQAWAKEKDKVGKIIVG